MSAPTTPETPEDGSTTTTTVPAPEPTIGSIDGPASVDVTTTVVALDNDTPTDTAEPLPPITGPATVDGAQPLGDVCYSHVIPGHELPAGQYEVYETTWGSNTEFLPCGPIVAPTPDAADTVAEVGVPTMPALPAELPATGAGTVIGVIGAVCIVSGAILSLIALRDRGNVQEDDGR